MEYEEDPQSLARSPGQCQSCTGQNGHTSKERKKEQTHRAKTNIVKNEAMAKFKDFL